MPYRFTLLYLLLIPLVNWAFSWTPLVALPDGGMWSPFSIAVGLILVVRDFAQREIGQYIFIPLIIGVAISFLMAPPEIAAASGIAFFVSELVDWALYTFTKKPLSTRVMISSLASAPVDSIIYLSGANMAIPGLFSWWTLGTMIISKLLGAYVVYRILRKKEQSHTP
ncbi:MAG: VUT family protein [Alphaproteobacteria bacterium]|nr:VUT family protein [Alphaproteobacteria bacterium]